MIERYSLPEISAVFTEKHKFETWLKVELAYTEALVKEGKVPAEALTNIRKKAVINPDRISEIEKTTNHDVIAFLESLSETVGTDARFIHVGLTSSDIVDTANMIIAQEALTLIMKKTKELASALYEKAQKHRHTPCIGRTHGIHAEPMTIGLKFLLYFCELKRHEKKAQAVCETLRVGKFSGAVGTYSQNDPQTEKTALSLLGLAPCLLTTQVIQRDRLADYFYLLALTGATLEKIATEIRHLQRSELREMEEPFRKGQKGSSAMPHKRNPIICERICGISRLLRGYLIPSLENIPLWHERDISHSSVERVTLPDASIACYYALHKMTEVISGITVNQDRTETDLHLLGDIFFSQKLLLHLIEHCGLERAHAYTILQEVTHCLYHEKKHLSEAARSHKVLSEMITEKQLSEITDLNHYFRHIDFIFERAEKEHQS